jgi:hypothetical protein
MSLVVAILLSVLSAVLAFGGSALQALEARRVPSSQALRASLLGTLLRRPLWLLGTGVNIVAFGIQLAALSVSSLAIVQPIFAVGLIVLAVIGVTKLGEKLGLSEYAGGVLIILGLASLALVAPRHNHLPLSWWFGAPTLAALCALVSVLAAMRLTGRSDGLAASCAAGLLYAWVGIGGTLLGEAFSRSDWTLVIVWGAGTTASAVLAVLAEMTALQTWPVTRSKPVVFVLQTIFPAFLAPFFAAGGFGPVHGAPFVVSLLVVAGGSIVIASSSAVAEAGG